MQVWLGEDLLSPGTSRGVIQHPTTGFIYVAAYSGVLEFDGVRWRTIPLPSKKAVQALAVDRRGRVWYASFSWFGWLAPDAVGELQPVPFAERIPGLASPLIEPLGLLAVDDGVLLVLRKQVCFFPEAGGSPTLFNLHQPLSGWWIMDGRPWLAFADGTRFIVREGRLDPAPKGAPRVLAATATMLLTLRGPMERTASLPPPSDLAKEQTSAAIPLRDGRFAYGTGSGLFIADRTGKIVQRITRASGLPSNRIYGLTEDREGAVWLALSDGVIRVQLDSPFARHGQSADDELTVSSVERIGTQLIGSNSEGIVEVLPTGGLRKVTSLPITPAELIASASPNLAAMALGRLMPSSEKVPGFVPSGMTSPRVLRVSTEPGLFVWGKIDGLWLCRTEGDTWKPLGRIAGLRGRCDPWFEAPAGVIWATVGAASVRIDFRGGARLDPPFSPTLWRERFTSVELPDSYKFTDSITFPLGPHYMCNVGTTLLRYDAATDRFVPADRIEGWAALTETRPTLASGRAARDGTTLIRFREPDGRVVRLKADKLGQWQVSHVISPPPGLADALASFDELTHTLWLTRPRTMVSVDLDWKPSAPPAPFSAVIRRIEHLDGTPLTSRRDPSTPAAPLALTSAQTTLRAAFAAPAYYPNHKGETHTVFRTRLNGLDKDWTPWSAEPFRDFTNLPWRTLTLRVQARDQTGRESTEDSLVLAIAAPWWATRVAFLGYGALGLCAVAGLVNIRTRAAHARAERLEAIVAERTAELATKNTELTRLHRLELDEKTAARLAEEKTRLEMLRYQLNPHFLANSLAALRTLVGPSATGAREMIERLASFCRMALTRRDETATVRDEIEMLRAYLDTEKSRWRDMLDTTIEADPATLDLPLPPFLLLPLVENAIKYGGQTSPDVLRIRVAFALAPDGQFLITITNTGTWLTPDPTRADSTGIGLDNIRQRLRRHYPDAHEFTTEAKDGHVIARLRLNLSLSSLS